MICGLEDHGRICLYCPCPQIRNKQIWRKHTEMQTISLSILVFKDFCSYSCFFWKVPQTVPNSSAKTCDSPNQNNHWETCSFCAYCSPKVTQSGTPFPAFARQPETKGVAKFISTVELEPMVQRPAVFFNHRNCELCKLRAQQSIRHDFEIVGACTEKGNHKNCPSQSSSGKRNLNDFQNFHTYIYYASYIS